MINTDKINTFNKLLNSVDCSKNKFTVFSDFLTLSAYSLAQPFYRSQQIEEKYLAVAKNYKLHQLTIFSQMLAVIVDALEKQAHDFLGNCFLSNDMGSEYRGQFFTPYPVCQMMAQIQFQDVKELIVKQGFVTVSEPCSGAGGMIIAAREVLIQEGYNPSTDMFVEAIDIDDLCFKMSFIQLSLLGVAARVIRGNTLSMEVFEMLYTPVYFINRWHYKLSNADQKNEFVNTHDQDSEKEGYTIKISKSMQEMSQLCLFKL